MQKDPPSEWRISTEKKGKIRGAAEGGVRDDNREVTILTSLLRRCMRESG